MELHLKTHEMTFDHMKKVRGVPAERIEKELMMIQDVMVDRIFEEHGFEGEHVNLLKTRHNLDADHKYHTEYVSYMQRIQFLGLGGPDQGTPLK